MKNSLWAIGIFLLIFIVCSFHFRIRNTVFMDKTDIPVAGGYGIDFQINYSFANFLKQSMNEYLTGHETETNVYPPFNTLAYTPFTFLPRKHAYFIFSWLSLLSFFSLIHFSLKKFYTNQNFDHIKSTLFTLLVGGVLFQTYPVLFSFERGNNDILLIALSLLAISALNSRPLASVLLLTFTTQIKIFPALLAPFILIKSSIKHFVLYITLNFILLFCLGLDGLKFFFTNVRRIMEFPSIWQGNHSLASGLETYAKFFINQNLTLQSMKPLYLTLTALLLGIYGLTFLSTKFLKLNKESNFTLLTSLALTLICLLPAHSHDYKLATMLPAFFLILGLKTFSPLRLYIIAFFMGLLFIPPHYTLSKTPFLIVILLSIVSEFFVQNRKQLLSHFVGS